MSSGQDRSSQRAKRKSATGAVETRKRKSRTSKAKEEDSVKRQKRRNSSQTKIEQYVEIDLAANETLDCCIDIGTDSKEYRRKSLRTHSQKQQNEDGTCTPKNLIDDMTSFTFSNYFIPVSKENSPLPKLTWANNNEVWEIMLQKDRKYKRDPLYLRRHQSLQPRMRSILLDWLIEVCEVYRLHRETFHLAVDFVDRYLSVTENISKQRLQLLGVTALFIAAKLEEIYPPKLSEFAYVTDGACTEDEISKQELILLQALRWDLQPVTPNTWLTTYLQIANKKSRSNVNLEKPDAKFEYPKFSGIFLVKIAQLIDLCLLDIGSLKFSYSIIAASCLYHMVPVKIAEITGHSWDELYECIQWLVPYAQITREEGKPQLKHFDKIPSEDSHNIQTHTNGLRLLDEIHTRLNRVLPINNLSRVSPIQHQGLLTPPSSAKKDYDS